MFVARLVALTRLSPRSNRMTTLISSLPTTMRVIDRVHCHTARDRLLAKPTSASGLSEMHVHVVFVSDFTDRRKAFLTHHPHLVGRKLQGNIVALFGDNERTGSRRTHHLTTAAGLELDIMNHESKRDLIERKRVASLKDSLGTAHDNLTDLQALRRKNIPLLAVDIVDQGDIRAAVRIILDRRHLAGDIELIPLEIDLSKFSLMSTTAMPDADPTVRRASALLTFTGGQGLLRS